MGQIFLLRSVARRGRQTRECECGGGNVTLTQLEFRRDGRDGANAALIF